MKFSFILALAAVLAALTGCETGPSYGEVGVYDRDYGVRVVFSDSDRALIRDYYRAGPYRLPPGLAKQGKVPPGHAYRMARHQPLPPGVGWDPLPPDLGRRLSRLPEGYAHIMIGGEVGILDIRTRVILDVVEPLRD